MNDISKQLENTSMSRLVLKYSLPAILSGLVSSLYNIVDQIFIGQSVGMLGNAATNVAYPLVTITTSLTLLLGIGGAANFSLSLGRKQVDNAKKFLGNALVGLSVCGVIITILTLCFLSPLLYFFGATESNFAYAYDYVFILAFGFPFFMFGTGASQLIRADGSPKYASKCILTGAILNCVLDPIFIFVLNMGIQGAAIATIIGQIVSCMIAVLYFRKFRTFQVTKSLLKIQPHFIKKIAILGMAPCFNQLAMTVMQIVMNNTLTYYGALSVYGSDIPLACVGIITKVNFMFISIAIGIAQGTQPITGYCYGAKKYDKVTEAFKIDVKFVSVVSVLAFCAFQIFPRQITALFGSGSDEYFDFAVRFFRVFMMMAFINGIQPITANFFTAIGKPIKGLFMSLTKQLIFLVPLIVILPIFMGVEGVLYAGPIADLAAFLLALVFILKEFKSLKSKHNEQIALESAR